MPYPKGTKLKADHLKSVSAHWSVPKPLMLEVKRVAKELGIPASHLVVKVMQAFVDTYAQQKSK